MSRRTSWRMSWTSWTRRCERAHPQAPLKIAPEATPGLKPEKTTLGKADPVDPKADGRRFEVPFVAEAAGKQEARAKVDFFICSDQWCVKQVKDVTAAVDVRAR